MLSKNYNSTLRMILTDSNIHKDTSQEFQRNFWSFIHKTYAYYLIYLLIKSSSYFSMNQLKYFKKTKIIEQSVAGVFYSVKNGLSFTASKSSLENIINHNKHLCFCSLQDKTWIKMPKWTIFFNTIKNVCFDYWDFMTNFLK